MTNAAADQLTVSATAPASSAGLQNLPNFAARRIGEKSPLSHFPPPRKASKPDRRAPDFEGSLTTEARADNDSYTLPMTARQVESRNRPNQRSLHCVPAQSPGHSAHIGQEVEVHYRWHALYGRRLRRQYVERRAGGDVVHVEVTPGVVIVVAAWMLDPAACAGMGLGTPRVTLSALAELHQLLVEHGFRRSSPGGSMTIREERDENPAVIG